MTSSSNDDLQALVELTNANPSLGGSFQALLIMLEQAPDSELIISTLSQVDAGQIANVDHRRKAAKLLRDADSSDLADMWEPVDPDNVVPLNSNVVKPSLPGDKITFQDIGGLENVKKQVRRKIISPFQDKKALFQRFKRKAGGGILMYGPPGCGKTMLARALATECNAAFHAIRAADVLNQYVGNAEKEIARLFAAARAERPVVLFFDEVEALAQRRQFESSTNVNTVVSALLTEMDGFADDNEGMLFLGATNVPWSLDSAFRRPGRFDRSIFVPPPDKIARSFILKNLLEGRPTAPDLSIEKLVTKSMGYSGADLSALVETAVDYAIEESRSVDDLEPLSHDHFDEAFQEIKSSVSEWLSQARSFAEYANESGLYDDLSTFLKKHAK